MAEVIKCPSCGEDNPTDVEFCQYCQTRLQPLTGKLKGADAPILPGQFPTQKTTAELEPILPQWLRDARQNARQEFDPVQAEGSEKSQMDQRARPVEPKDLLAGLQSQAAGDEEDETPDWLANITGIQSSKPKAQTESADVRWVELGGQDESTAQTADEDDVPAWLAGLKSQEPVEQDDANEWLHSLSASSQPAASDAERMDMPSADASAWMKEEQNPTNDLTSMDSPNVPLDVPDWLLNMDRPAESAQRVAPADYREPGAGESEEPLFSSTDELPDWMKEVPKKEEPKHETTPTWLRKKDPDTAEVPAWLNNQNIAADDAPQPQPPAQQASSIMDDMPDWLKSVSSQTSNAGEDEVTIDPAQEADAPDWLSAMQGETTDMETPAAAESGEPHLFDLAQPNVDQSSGNLENLFADMPDWLSRTSNEPASPGLPASANVDTISPGALPSWVQAMRPVDTGSAQPSASKPSDQTLESRGALAGLQGVLASVPGFTPTSKPKAYSIKLQASDEQMSHASLLEQILAAETEPVPIASYSTLRTSNPLRWFITFIIFLITVLPISARTQIFSLPLGRPQDLNGALQVAQSIPEGAPILVAMNYEPARVGEMEAAAAPMFDQMILLKHPHLTFIAANESGAMLAERFISGPLAGHNYESGIQYLNLGYLPGGQMGIHAFAQNPRETSPLDVTLAPAWAAAPLDAISSLSQFAAMILLTDDADSARTWIEQTQSERGTMPFVVISSAQAAPMIEPYFDSGQISGQVAGLYGGAIFEQNNSGRPGIARAYWDAYSLGMLAAMALLVGGGLWSLALGLRDRAATRETE